MRLFIALLLFSAATGCTVYKYSKEADGKCEVTVYSWRDVKEGSLAISGNCDTSGSAESMQTNEAAMSLLELIKKIP